MNIVVYGDSMSWGIIPGTRNRLSPDKRWTGVLQSQLGEEYRVVEECLNGRTTRFEDENRPARNGLEHIQMLMESHSPIDLVIVLLGINDFQDIIGASLSQSANGLKSVVNKIQSLSPEPMENPASELAYINVLKGLNVHMFEASKFISLSKIDGIHIDEPEHLVLGELVANKVIDIFGE